MNKDFTIIFEKIEEQARLEEPGQQTGASMVSQETFIELDELAELRQIVTEITEPEPLSFTTT